MQPLSLDCRNCSISIAPPWPYIPNEAEVLTCGYCRTRYVVHKCQWDSHPILLAVLDYGLHYAVSRACPECEVAYNVGDVIERVNPVVGKEVKQVAFAVGLSVLAVSLISFLTKRR